MTMRIDVQDAAATWARIRAHRFDDPDAALDFCARLAREQGWTRVQADAAIEEYRRFCLLATVEPQPMTPSDAVDQVWHLHLQYTRDYWNVFCPDVLGCALHHGPTRGGAIEATRYVDQYADTLAAYQRRFGAPPEAWWPDTRERFRAPQRFVRIDTERAWCIARPDWRCLRGRVAAVAAAVGVPGVAVALPINPFDLSAGRFLSLYVTLMVVVSIGCLLWRRALRRQHDGSDRPPTLDTWQSAYLAAGPARVVDAGVADLLAHGVLAWDIRTRRLRIARDEAVDEPLAQIVKCVRADGAPKKVVRRCTPMLDSIRRSLVARHLWFDTEPARRIAALSSIPAWLLVGFGVLRILLGITRGRPVEDLTVLVVLSTVGALFLLLRRPARTPAGDRVLAALKARHAHAIRAPRIDDLALGVALAGTMVLATTAHGGYHQARNPSGDGGGGGESGDGDGGGGCGGCGGGD